jgi:hypothetical protein
VQTSEARDDWEERRARAEGTYEEALIEANSATIGTPRFLYAKAEVRAAREDLRAIHAARPS